MYRNTEALYSVVGQLYFKNKHTDKDTNKLIEKEIRFVVTRSGGWIEANWMKVVKRYKLPVIR